jgi:hypothetical protein
MFYLCKEVLRRSLRIASYTTDVKPLVIFMCGPQQYSLMMAIEMFVDFK